jgi:anti-sigma-K factor RskA
MQCRDIEEVLEQEGLAPLPEAARAHVARCPQCQDYLADLETIVSAAHELPAEVEPPARLWIALRAQLEREGLIKEPVTARKEERVSWWDFGTFFRSRAMATVTVGALIAAGAILELRQPRELPLPPEVVATVKQLDEQEIDVRNMHLASTSPVDAALEQNLKEIDNFIAECEHHLQQAPQDDLAREYLYSAYQQKAELLASMLDRGRSVN